MRNYTSQLGYNVTLTQPDIDRNIFEELPVSIFSLKL